MASRREFMDWQEKLGERLVHADGLDLRRARHRSPAIGIFRWSLGTMFAVMLAHQRRHIWQARQVLNQPGFPGTALESFRLPLPRTEQAARTAAC